MKKLFLFITLTIATLAPLSGDPVSDLVFSPTGKFDLGEARRRPAVLYGNSLDLGTSQTDGAQLVHKKVSLTKDQIFAMYGVPVAILAAPASGKTIIVAKLQFAMTRTSTAFTGGGAVIFQYGATVHGAGTQSLDSTLASTVVTGAAGTTYSTRNGAVISDLASIAISGVGIFISNDTAAFATGTGTAVVDVWYYVI